MKWITETLEKKDTRRLSNFIAAFRTKKKKGNIFSWNATEVDLIPERHDSCLDLIVKRNLHFKTKSDSNLNTSLEKNKLT